MYTGIEFRKRSLWDRARHILGRHKLASGKDIAIEGITVVQYCPKCLLVWNAYSKRY